MDINQKQILEKILSKELDFKDCSADLRSDKGFVESVVSQIIDSEREKNKMRQEKVCPVCGNNKFVIDFNATNQVESQNAEFWEKDLFGRKLEFCSACAFDINKSVDEQKWSWRFFNLKGMVGVIVREAKEELRQMELSKQHELEIVERARLEELLREKNRTKMEVYSRLRKEIEAMPEYQKWRRMVLEKYDHTCAKCGSKENLEVDHRYQTFYSIIKNYNISNIDDAYECRALWDVNNGAVLCKDCHDRTTSSQRYFSENR